MSPSSPFVDPGPMPKVSVQMIAYNHEKFIAQAIESVLQQETSFPVELIVGEDCSPDGTREIVRRYAQQYPGRIRPLLPERNLGMFANAQAVLAACRGEFIACLEGDDYWTSPQKLQRQVELLESRTDCALCFHDARVIDGDGACVLPNYCMPKPAPFSTTSEILARNFIPTCSVVYRRKALRPPSSALSHLPMGDWPSWVLLAQTGLIAYLDETWACYRLHAGGAWSGRTNDRQLRGALKFFEAMQTVLGPAHQPALRQHLKATLGDLVENLVYQGRWREARPSAWRYLLRAPRRFRAPAGKRGLYWRVALGVPSAIMRSQRPPPPALRSG